MYEHVTKHAGYGLIGRDAKPRRTPHPRRNRYWRHRRGLRASMISLAVAAVAVVAVLLANH